MRSSWKLRPAPQPQRVFKAVDHSRTRFEGSDASDLRRALCHEADDSGFGQFMLFFRGQARNERLERCQNVFGAVFQHGMRGVRQVQQARTFNLLGQLESLAAGNQEVIIAMDHKKRIDRTD